jgi:hypothetical protein
MKRVVDFGSLKDSSLSQPGLQQLIKEKMKCKKQPIIESLSIKFDFTCEIKSQTPKIPLNQARRVLLLYLKMDSC